ncbi:MAG: hypothetical protein AB1611_00235 [bacterium]
MNEEKSTQPGITQQGSQQPSQGVALEPSQGPSQAGHPEPSCAVPEVEDWRMNREWCLNQALDIVKSLKFEVKDVPAFLDAVYRKIIELANDARKGGKV